MRCSNRDAVKGAGGSMTQGVDPATKTAFEKRAIYITLTDNFVDGENTERQTSMMVGITTTSNRVNDQRTTNGGGLIDNFKFRKAISENLRSWGIGTKAFHNASSSPQSNQRDPLLGDDLESSTSSTIGIIIQVS